MLKTLFTLGHINSVKDKTVKLQSGEYWSLSCSTKLIGEVDGTAIVEDEVKKTEDDDEAKEIDFYLDIMCCDPNDTDCVACQSTELDATPIMKIGPKSNAESRFFVKTGMDTHGRNLGYFHIERLYYEAVDKDNRMVGKFDLIQNGCNRVGNLVEFEGEFNSVNSH